MLNQPLYRCPQCGLGLNIQANSYKCENNHCFDIAKEGYVNLLPVQKKKSIAPGDNAMMIQARKRFLSHGYYDGFATFLSDKVNEQQSPEKILDIGCGEGHYIGKISKKIAGSQPNSITVGVDISKSAVKACAKKIPHGKFAVASAFDLPFFSEHFDAIISIFSPLDLSEADRVLKNNSGSSIYMVGPGPNHLSALAEQVYDKVQIHQGNKNLNIPKNLVLSKMENYRERITVKGEHLPDLLLMTPYYWSCPEEKKLKIGQLKELQIGLDFELRVFRKRLDS